MFFPGSRGQRKRYSRLIAAGFTCLIAACATIPTTSAINPWEYPNRSFSVPYGEAQNRFIRSLQPCTDYANATFADALHRYQSGQLKGADFIAKVIDDRKFYAWIRVQAAEGGSIRGQVAAGHTIKGETYAAGSMISVKESDIVDWYIVYEDRPPEGNFIGRYMMLKQDGLAPGDCDPFNIEFQRYRHFSMSYSLVPPGTAGWEMRGPYEETDMSMQQKDRDLDEVNTFSASRYRIETANLDRELLEAARSFGRYGDEEGVRYEVLRLEAESYPHDQTRCARSSHVVEDREALLSQSGKRGPMIREVETLVCHHPADYGVAVVLIYSHRHRPGQKNPEFNANADKVFASLAFKMRH